MTEGLTQATPGWRYQALIRVASLVLIAHAAWKAFLLRDSRFFKERLGFVAPLKVKESAPEQWWHAASVGEIQTVWPLLRSVIEQRLKTNPNAQWLVTTNTSTGFHVLSQRLAQAEFSAHVQHAYAPIDTQSMTARFIRRVKPKQAVMVETELWPNLYTSLHQQHIPITLVNARATEKTLNSVRSKHKLATTMAPAYRSALASVRVLARSQDDAANYEKLGADRSLIAVVGDLKFSDNRPMHCTAPILPNDNQTPYVVAASTHANEEEQLAEQWMQQSNNGLLVLVPRHVERGDALYKTLSSRYPGALPAPRSQGGAVDQTHRLYLADTLGELHDWYCGAGAAFVGGSLIERGGHNVLEPYFHGLPVVTGLHTENFHEAVNWLRTQGGITISADAAETVRSLLSLRDSQHHRPIPDIQDYVALYSQWIR